MTQKRSARRTSGIGDQNAQINKDLTEKGSNTGQSSALSRLRKERGQEDISQKIVFERHVLQPKDFDEDVEMQMFMTEKFSLTSTMDEQLKIVQGALKRSEKEEVKEEKSVKSEEKEESLEKETEKKSKDSKKGNLSKEDLSKNVEKSRREKRKEARQAKKEKKLEKKQNKKKKTKNSLKRESLNEAFPVEKKQEKEKEEKVGRFGRKRQEKEIKEKKPLSFEKKLLFGAIAILLVLLAGYSYVVLIRNPQMNPTEEQTQLYDKLVEYADEWDMLSDTEKNELLDIEEEYDGLLTIQKSKINDYFSEQTGSTLNDVINNLKKKQKEETNENDPSYRVLYEYLKDWDNHTDNMKMAIITYKGLYDSLTPGLQTKINNFTKTKLDATFNTLYRQYNDVYVSEIGSIPVMYSAYRNQIKSEYQTELEELQKKYMELSTKETALQEQKKQYSENSEKYKSTVEELEYNEVSLAQVQQLIDFYSQIVEQYNVVQSSIIE